MESQRKNQRQRIVFRGGRRFVVDGGEKSGEVQSISVDMVPTADDVLPSGEEYVTLIWDPDSDQSTSSSPLGSTGACRMRIIKPPVVLTKNGMELTPVRLHLCLRKVEQGQAAQEADVTPVRLRFHLRCMGQVRAAQESAVASTQESDQEAVSLISDAPSSASQVPPESDVMEKPVPPEIAHTPEVEPTTAPVCELEKSGEVQCCSVNVAPAADMLPRVQTDECPRQTYVCLPQKREKRKACTLSKFSNSGLTSSSESEADDPESDLDIDPRFDPETGLPWDVGFSWCTKKQRRKGGKRKQKPISPVPPNEMHKTVVQLRSMFKTVEKDLDDLEQPSHRSHRQSGEEDIHQAIKTIRELPVNTNKRLRDVVRTIYDRAVSDDKHCTDFADLCHELKDMKVKTSNTSMTFQKIMLDHCMDEFKKDIKKAPNVNDRSCCFNKMLFICELFKRKMLTVQDMHDCIAELLKNPTEDNLYCFCCLMSNIGKNLNKKTFLEKYFQEIQILMWKQKLSNQIIDLLKCVLYARKRKWPRNKISELQNSVRSYPRSG